MINIIVGMTKNRVIGKDNSLPWHLPEDLKNFKALTENNTVIMGRKTWESIPEKFKPLPNRNNIVISKNMLPIDNVDVCKSIEEALEKAKSYQKEIFIIGGSSIYEQFLPITDKMYISYLKNDYAGDTYFPNFNKENWEIIERKDFTEFEFVIFQRK
ncbi:dihydrofolate reductase [Candidatus Woesearchaeota archaeon]|nr:dihydrofolate reductase [Candidatus Woesearchaeota archaeon]